MSLKSRNDNNFAELIDNSWQMIDNYFEMIDNWRQMIDKFPVVFVKQSFLVNSFNKMASVAFD